MGRVLKGTVYLNGPDGQPVTFPAGTAKSKLPDWAEVDDGALVDEAAADPGAPAEPILGDYASRTVPELTLEVERRNADRPADDQVLPDGSKKKDLVTALEADDAVHAAPPAPITSEYDSHTVPELEGEVTRRNTERGDDDQVEVGGRGNKGDIVKALEADDAAHAS